MKYGLLVKKVHLDGRRYLTSEEVHEACAKVGVTYRDGINYLIRTGHLVRILKGFFYMRSLEERKAGATNANFFEALSKALARKKVDWYFGFDTALKLNNLTHEYFPVDYVVSDKLFRPKPVNVLGHEVKFIKLKKSLFGFGIKSEGSIRYSDLEKTILDIIYIRKHNGATDAVIRNEIAEFIGRASKKKLKRYAERYPISVRKIL